MSGPVETVIAALPGTLPELAAKTGFSVEIVHKLILRARQEGRRLHAVRDVAVVNVPARAKPEADAVATIYVDKSVEGEVE